MNEAEGQRPQPSQPSQSPLTKPGRRERIRAALRSRRDLRDTFLVKEVVDRPISLRGERS